MTSKPVMKRAQAMGCDRCGRWFLGHIQQSDGWLTRECFCNDCCLLEGGQKTKAFATLRSKQAEGHIL